MEKKEENKWLSKLPDDGRDFLVYGRNKGDKEYYPMDIVQPAFLGDKKDATHLKKEDLESVIPAMKESWTEVEWKVMDAEGVEYMDSLQMGSETGREQDTATQQPASYSWPEGGRFVEVDEKAMMAALKMGIDVSTRDFANGVPPTNRRIAIGLAGAVINPQADRESFGQVIRDNRYPFDNKVTDALWSIREQYYANELTLNQIVNVVEKFFDGPEQVQEIAETPAEGVDGTTETVAATEEEESPFQQIKEAVDAVRKEENYKVDIGKLANRLTDDLLKAAIDYVQRYKGRNKAVKANLGNIARQVQNVIDERYNAKHPDEAEQQAYAKTIEYLKQGKGMDNFSIDDYIRSHERERDEARSKGLDGWAAVQQGVVRASWDIRKQWKEEQAKVQDAPSEKEEQKNVISFFRMQNGHHGINETVNGVRSATRRVSDEDVEWYFKDLKGSGSEEVARRRAVLADKYLHAPQDEQIKAEQRESKAAGKEKYAFPPVRPEVRSRLSEASVYRMRDGVNFAVRCKIDGEQQGAKVLRNKDVAAFFDEYKGQSKEFQQERKDQVAALYFKEELEVPKEEQEQVRGMKR